MLTLYKILSKKTKKRIISISFYVLSMGFIEIFGISSIIPYLSILGNPSLIESNQYLSYMYDFTKDYGIKNSQEFLFLTGLISLLIIIFSAIIKIICTLKINNFIEHLRHEISSSLFYIYLSNNYCFFLKRNTTDFTKIILSEIDHLINVIIRPVVTMFSSFIVLLSISIMLLIVNPYITLFTFILISILYTTLYLSLREKIYNIGDQRVHYNNDRFRLVTEAFFGIKMVKMYNLESKLLEDFNKPSKGYANSYSKQQTINQVPNYLVESIMFGSLLGISSFLVYREGVLDSNLLGEVLPLLGIYAFAAYRLKPSMQMIFNGVASLRNGTTLISQISTEFNHQDKTASNLLKVEDLGFEHEILFKDVSFAYDKDADSVLNNINFSLNKEDSLGIIGKTGTGKSTIINLLLGLVRPTKGLILIDGKPLTKYNLRSWQNKIGYVPQEIYLSDKTIKENIAFGKEITELNFERVMECAKSACIHDFIVNDLQDGYDTCVGERGIRLSGGQRQRLGIARALYKGPKILIFDEATSALDMLTESQVLKSIHDLSRYLTIIMVTHRVSTIKGCDLILELGKGNMNQLGTFKEFKFNSDD